jgi:hypothetical protein
MARHAIPSFSVLWEKHETIYISIFILALQRLWTDRCDTGDEDMISERLCPILNTVCFEESQKDNGEIRTPDWEKPIQPVTDSELNGGKIRKRPDFTCKITNPFACNPYEHEIPLHVECKRLGAPTSSSWILNKNYVVNGIKRFDSGEHGYGKRASSGMIVGYITSMSPKIILNEVNTHQKEHCSNYPAIEFEFVKNKVQQYQQKFDRKNLKPELFKLVHLWIDLNDRSNSEY